MAVQSLGKERAFTAWSLGMQHCTRQASNPCEQLAKVQLAKESDEALAHLSGSKQLHLLTSMLASWLEQIKAMH